MLSLNNPRNPVFTVFTTARFNRTAVAAGGTPDELPVASTTRSVPLVKGVFGPTAVGFWFGRESYTRTGDANAISLLPDVRFTHLAFVPAPATTHWNNDPAASTQNWPSVCVPLNGAPKKPPAASNSWVPSVLGVVGAKAATLLPLLD